MDEEPKKSHKLPSMLEISEMFDKVQSQMNPLSYHLENSNSLLRIASQYEHLHSAVNTLDIASKAIQPVDFASSSVVDHSVIAMNAQLRLPEAMALQNTFLEMKGRLNAHSNAMSAKDRLIQSMGGQSAYEDIMAAVELARKPIEPWRDSFGIARKAFNGSEFANFVREMQTSRIISESTVSEYSDIFKQFEYLSNLESLKALSKLENFPNDTEFDKAQVSDTALEEPKTILAEVKRLDAKINKEVCTVDDFNDLSEETKRNSNLFLKYYYWLVINLVVSLCLLEDSLDKDLDLSKKSFTIADNVGEVIIDIGHYWNGNKVVLFNGFIVTQISKFVSLIID